MSFYYGVITKVPGRDWEGGRVDGGNLASAMDVYREVEQPTKDNNYAGKYEHIGLEGMLTLRVPVFELGEILVMETSTDREIGGAGRKPSKWSVECERFDNVGDAVKRALEVLR